MYQGRELVKAELLADTSAIVPGKPFTVGVLLHMQPHWHTYWKFPGDAGLPSEIKWNLPPGWKVGDIQWPIPRKMLDPGDIQTYGYEDDLMLMQEITPPDSLGDGPVKISAQASWLVCERLCIPGSANLSLTLARSTSSSPANTELFAHWRKTLPQNPPGDLQVQTARGPNELSILLKSSAIPSNASADFYPLPDEKTVVGHPKSEWRGDTLVITVPVETNPPNELHGLVVFSDGSGWYVGEAPPRVATQISKTADSRGLWTFMLFGFIGGLILNLMPCVLPVISLKIFGFIKHAGQDRQAIVRNGVAFVLGIFVWFVGLAALLIALKAAGHQVTWAAQFTNPYFVLILSVIVLVFALDLFGVFEIILPQSLMHRMLHSATREGEAGSFFQGVFATALATPCTAPFLGTALGFAFTQSPLVIMSIFLAIAAGMSAPYLALSIQPAWIRFLPKPGAWMDHVKQFMGFLLLATLLFLLYVLGAQRGYEALIWASCFLLVVALACWMKGRFITPVTTGLTKSIVLLLMSILLVSSGWYFIADKFASAKIDIVQASGDWQSFTPERLKTELDQDHAVFVDFTAAWCLTCKFNEKTVLESAQVRDAFTRHAVTKMKADWTNGDPGITKILQQFGRPGVPMYVLYPGKSAEPFVFPELLTKGLVLEKLETITRSTIASQ
jgi:thiol:disulfide interchange protein/DsbC/DsbD-like thiol-disulfide interchange protein